MLFRSLSLEMARTLARKMKEPNAQEFIRSAFLQVLARPATAKEITLCAEFLSSQEQHLRKLNPSTKLTSNSPEKDVVSPAQDAALRARENLIHVLMNHNDFVTVR